MAASLLLALVMLTVNVGAALRGSDDVLELCRTGLPASLD